MATTFRYRLGGGEERVVEVAGDELRIGRDASCGARVHAEDVELQHCRVVRTPIGWTVTEDDKTRLGTYVVVAGEALPRLVYPARALGPGDQILIGHLSDPRFRGWFDEGTARSVAAPLAGDKRPTAAPTPAPPDRTAELAEELERLRTESALMRRERDAAVVECERLRQDRVREVSRLQHDYERELTAAQDRVTAQASQIAELKDQLARLREAKHELTARVDRERIELERSLTVAAKTAADANDNLLLAERRAVIIEEQSGQIAVLEVRLAERAAELKNRETELARVKAMLAAVESRPDG